MSYILLFPKFKNKTEQEKNKCSNTESGLNKEEKKYCKTIADSTISTVISFFLLIELCLIGAFVNFVYSNFN